MPFILALLLLLVPANVSADLVISEIMYDPSGADTGREWFEVTNTGSEAIDVSQLKFFENGTQHSLVLARGSAFLGPNAYAVVAQTPEKFLVDWPGFSGTLFDSSWSSLSNSGEALAFKDPKGALLAAVSYRGGVMASGDGNALARVGNAWRALKPTPGATNDEQQVIVPPPKVEKGATSKTISTAKKSPEKSAASRVSPVSEQPVGNSVSSAESAAALLSGETIPLYYWIGALFGLILGGSGILLYLRKSGAVTPHEADEFTIIE